MPPPRVLRALRYQVGTASVLDFLMPFGAGSRNQLAALLSERGGEEMWLSKAVVVQRGALQRTVSCAAECRVVVRLREARISCVRIWSRQRMEEESLLQITAL